MNKVVFCLFFLAAASASAAQREIQLATAPRAKANLMQSEFRIAPFSLEFWGAYGVRDWLQVTSSVGYTLGYDTAYKRVQGQFGDLQGQVQARAQQLELFTGLSFRVGMVNILFWNTDIGYQIGLFRPYKTTFRGQRGIASQSNIAQLSQAIIWRSLFGFERRFGESLSIGFRAGPDGILIAEAERVKSLNMSLQVFFSIYRFPTT